MVILVGGEKGGTGKSTLVTNLAVYLTRQGRDVLLLDADRQGTSALWAAERANNPDLPQVACVQKYGNLYNTIRDLAGRYEYVLVDAGGRDSEELRSAMVAASVMYSPFRPSQSDLWTAEHLASLVAMARGLNPDLEARAVLSLAPTNPRVQEIAEARAMLGQFEALQVSSVVLHDRKAYRDAMIEGRGVLEADDDKAREEIQSVAHEALGTLETGGRTYASATV